MEKGSRDGEENEVTHCAVKTMLSVLLSSRSGGHRRKNLGSA